MKWKSFSDNSAVDQFSGGGSELIVEFGDRLVDRASNDYRALNDWLKNSEAEAQILAQPKVMTRPVICDRDRFYLGWNEAVQKALLDQAK